MRKNVGKIVPSAWLKCHRYAKCGCVHNCVSWVSAIVKLNRVTFIVVHQYDEILAQ